MFQPKKTITLLTGLCLLSLSLFQTNAAPKKINGAVIDPEKQQQLIKYWGYDIKQPGKAEKLTLEKAKQLFVTDEMNLLRVSIWGDKNHPAHPSSGKIVASYYQDTLTAMKNAKAVRKDIVFFASKKLEGKESFPDWVKDENGVIAKKYAQLLADYLKFMHSKGFRIDILGIDNESQYNEGKITPEKHVEIVTELKNLLKKTKIKLPLIIGPDDYGPYAKWLKSFNQQNFDQYIDIAGTHYYPKHRAVKERLSNWVQAVKNKPMWHTELHWGKKNPDTAALGAIFDCIDYGFEGFIWWAYTDSGNRKTEMQRLITANTILARPIEIDDLDGKSIDVTGELWTRAFRKDDIITVWAINTNEIKTYKNFTLSLKQGLIDSEVTYQQWQNDSTSSNTQVLKNKSFELTLPANSITMFKFKYKH